MAPIRPASTIRASSKSCAPSAVRLSDPELRSEGSKHAPPTPLDLAEVAQSTKSRVLAWLERKGYLRGDEDPDEAEQPASALQACLIGSLGVGQLHALPKTGKRRSTVEDRPKPRNAVTAESQGFNIHAGVRVAAGATESRERPRRTSM